MNSPPIRQTRGAPLQDAPTLAVRQAELLGQLPPGYVAAVLGDAERARRALAEAAHAAVGDN